MNDAGAKKRVGVPASGRAEPHKELVHEKGDLDWGRGAEGDFSGRRISDDDLDVAVAARLSLWQDAGDCQSMDFFEMRLG